MSRIRVVNEKLMEGLLAPEPLPVDADGVSLAQPAARREEAGTPMSPLRAHRLQHKKHLKELEDLRARRYERSRRDAAAMAVESDRRVREHIAVQKLKKEEQFQQTFSSILEGRGLAATIKKQQDLEDQADHNKKVRQFEEWNLEVYGKIQGRVAEHLDAVAPIAITRRRNAEYQKFLDMTNTKGAIFRDIIIESEYDPLEPNRNSIKVASGDLVDPTSRVLDKNLDEKYMLATKATMAAARKPHTREVLDVLDWGTGRIEDTPHGFFAKVRRTCLCGAVLLLSFFFLSSSSSSSSSSYSCYYCSYSFVLRADALARMFLC